MISTEIAISRIRRDLTLGRLVRWAFAIAAISVVSLSGNVFGVNPSWGLLLIGIAWVAIAYSSVRGSRLTAELPSLISTGQYDEAERQAAEAVTSFSVFRNVKLLSLHQLAVLRHAQHRWGEAAALARALLGQRLGTMQGLDTESRLILAESLAEMGDGPAAFNVISDLLARPLSLSEQLKVLAIQTDCQAGLGQWDQMISNVMPKVQLAELMQSKHAARVQALLAVAARRQGRPDLADWLGRRAELLADMQDLARERPVLMELWQK